MSDDHMAVQLPTTLAYLAMRMLPEHQHNERVLMQSMFQRHLTGMAQVLHEQAHSGMPDAILPFRRDALDIAFAAAAAQTRGHYRFRGLGHCVDAGYFEISQDRLEYVDEVTRSVGYRSELLPWEATTDLIKTLDKISLKPVSVRVEDPQTRGFLSITGGWVDEMLRANQPENRRTRPREHISADIRLLVMQDGEEPELISRVRVGRFTFKYEPEGLLLKDIKPEQMMEMQAAWFKFQAREGYRLWLLIDNAHIRLLAPMPDLLEPGANSRAWLYPFIHIQQLLGGSEHMTMITTRQEMRDLMQRFNWMSAQDEVDWIRLAHTLIPQALEVFP